MFQSFANYNMFLQKEEEEITIYHKSYKSYIYIFQVTGSYWINTGVFIRNS